MQLISLVLRNIRSYTNAKLDFPTGTVVLSGDIGSGKSTTLLAIEFAFFGVLRGELSGGALLRHGTNEGSVELTFQIEKKVYTIKRTLKRTKKSIEQGTGYLIVDGVKKEATPIELKSYVLELLGYPAELLTKSKNFIYRYTVYTPQEEMKRILMEDKDNRVAILRKVFGIDKYERITQNAESYAKALRERKRALDALTIDVEEKRKQAEEAKEEQQQVLEKIKDINPQLELAREKLAESKQKTAEIEKKRQEAEVITRDLHVCKSQVLTKQKQQEQFKTDFSTISQQLIEAHKDLPEKADASIILKRKTELNDLLLGKEGQIKQNTVKIAELNALKGQSVDIAQKVFSISKCPTCLQEVKQDHKHQIVDAEKKKVQEIDDNLAEHTSHVRKSEQELKQIKEEIEKIRQQEKEAAVAQLKIQRAEELTNRKMLLEKQNNELSLELQTVQGKVIKFEEQLIPLKDVNLAYEQLRKEVELAGEEERKLSIEHSTLLQKQQHAEKTLSMLKKELESKEEARKQLEKTQYLHQWLTDYFIPIIDVIEKHVMAKIHHEFDALFQEWFGMLVEDVMTARLDDTFTPIVQQNGYDTEIVNLSGGERTACALAYRLALNKTINSLISTIKTKDLIMLDEPTDGFSAEQLDKMRDVLDQLNLRQVIIVSHEQKIESFADHIIRVHKTEHTSQLSF